MGTEPDDYLEYMRDTIGFHREPSQDWSFAPGKWLWAYRLQF